MRKKGKLWIIFFLLLGIFIQPVAAKEAFTIEHLEISMMVQEDGTYDITEEYTLNFSEYRHGFYRTIPTKYEMQWTDENGNADYKNYYFPIDHISCGDASTCDVDVDSGGVMIRIGDPEETVIGEQHYTIRYRVHSKDLGVKDTQMLYWNLIGNGFDTTIKKMHYTITMPKPFDGSRISAYTGSYGAAYDGLSFEVKDQVISGELRTPLNANESATIMVPLDANYFVFPQPQDVLLYAIVASVAILLVSGLLFWCFGKDDDVIVTVEFQAPEGLDSAAVGYIVDSMVEQKDIISLIIDWADRGYLKIHDDGKGNLSLEKIKDMEKEDTKAYERTFFQAIFKQKDYVTEKDLKKDDVARGLTNAQSKVSQYFRAKNRRVFTSSSLVLQFVMCLMVALPSFLCAFATLYMRYEMMDMTFPSIFIGFFGIAAAVPWIVLMRKRYVMKRWLYFTLWGACFLLNAVIFAITVILMLVMGRSNAWIYALIYFVVQILQLFILMFMDKRTKQGNRWLGQILGLREFILSCEKDRLETLIEDDPSAFFHVLPYAYVLGVSDVWASKFEHLIVPQPQWYVNPYSTHPFTTWYWWSTFHHSFHRMSRTITYVEPKGGHSGGVGGGSIGGFSGGGFSGGGFGGGGGGSW